ncbi:cellulose binding domain-containing protein [Spirosoma sp. KUDC1026]|uniref:cellulose binding domain-containing protein n=1 Tax=Spirosoma sp. KUDC1026 TaxID=2745947 RepID=UPI00159BB3A8|nr:cellulose binding domain-containing protein [Spirosoma sp. KUDC1026]QKZ13568.1 hypothetical protein HU175_13360 [Spirosoma sp. KUDC1026]
MKHHYLFKPQLTLVWWLLILLFSRVPTGYAQSRIYYAVSDGSLNSFNDQLRSIPLNGGGESVVYSNNGGTNFPASLAQIAYDAVGDRVFVANVVATSPALYVVSTSGTSSLFATISPIASSTATVVTGIVVDNVGGYVYYNVSDNNFRTSSDQLRRIPLAGGSEEIVVNSNTTNFPLTPQTLVIDRQNNRLLVANGVSSTVSDLENNNLYVSAVNLSTRVVTKAFSFAEISSGGATVTTTQGGLAVNTADNSLYYVLRDNGIGTFNDQLRRIPLSGGPEQIVVDVNSNTRGFPTAPGSLAYDAVNNRILVNDISINNRDIAAVTPAGNITLLLDNGAQIGTANTGIVGLAVGTAQAPTTVTSITLNGTSLTNASTVQFTVTFASSVAGITTSNFATSPGSGITGSSIASVSGSGTTYTVSVNTGSGSGTLGLTLANDNGLTPSISNEPFTGTSLYTIDKTPPAAPVALTPANGSFINTTMPSYVGTAEASSTVTVIIDGSSIGTTTANSAGNWSLSQPTALAQGSHTVRARATDAVGNNSVDSNTNTFIVDSVRPTATIGSSAQNPTSTSPIPFTITFSETVTSFVGSDLTVTGGTITGFSGSGTTYTFSVTLTTSGVVTVELPANVAQDNAGNSNTEASPLSITYNQPVTAAPVVLTPANGSRTNDSTPDYSGTAPANSTVMVYVDGSSIGTTSADALGNWRLTQPTALSQDNHTVYATAQSSGSTVSVNSNTNTFTVDTVAPTVSSVGVPANGTYRTGQTLPITVNMSELVTVTGAPQVGLTIGATTRQATYVSGSGTQALLFSYTVQAGDSDTDGIAVGALTLNGGTIRDGVGNDATLTLNTVPSTVGVLVDGVAPTVSSSDRQNPTGPLTNGTAVIFRVSFNEAVTGVNNGSFSLITTDGSVTGTIVSTQPVNNTSNSQYDVIVSEVQGNGTLRLDVNSSGSGITDLAGNPISGGFTSGQTFTIDQIRPTVTISSSAAPNAGTTRTSPIPFAVTFSESVTEFVAGDITLTNGTLSGFTGSGTTYTFIVTPLANGPVTVNIAANVAQDAAINGNTAANPYSISYLPLTLTGFAPLNSNVCVGSPLTFTATVSNADGPYSYTLTNGNGPVTGTGDGTAFSRTITAAGEGLQSFTLIVTDASQRVSASQSITVNPLPAVSITGLASAYCKDAATVTLVGSPAGGTFTIDGNQAAQFNPAVLPVGSHTVIYSYTNSSGCSQTTSQTVTVKEVPNAPVVTTQSGQSTVTVDLNTGNVTLLISGCAGSINWTGPNNSAGTSNTISVPTTQAGTFVYRASCTVEGCTGPLATATVTVGARLTVLHRDVDNYADNNAIQPLLVLQNNSTGPLPLSRVTLRYYVTVEGGGTLGNLSMNYAQVGNQNVRLRYVALNPAQQGATGYVEYSFTEGAGSLATGADSGPIQSYFTKSDYGPLNELDDYSYNTVRNQLTGNLRITAYYDGALIAGVEPGSGVQVRAVRALTESKNGPDATQISTYLEVRNEGNVAINYSDLKARYYFTSDGNERLQVEVDEGNVSARLVKLPQPVNGADTYLELIFNQSGQLAPGTSTGTIRYRISKPDGGRFNQANDYSYQEQPQDRSQNSRVVVYAGNERLWGQEPSGSARVAYAEAGTELTIKVLGNPIQNDQVSVEVTGAEGQALQLQLLTPQGRVVHQQHVPSAEATQRHQLSVAGQAGGLFLLQVSTPTQSKTVKVIKAD